MVLKVHKNIHRLEFMEIAEALEILKAKGEPVPRKTKAVTSAGKVIVLTFWNTEGIIFIK